MTDYWGNAETGPARALRAVGRLDPMAAETMTMYTQGRVPSPHSIGEFGHFTGEAIACSAEEIIGLRERVEELERQEQNRQRAAARERQRRSRERKRNEEKGDDGG